MPTVGEPLRVLLVEHDRSDAELCVLALTRAGFDVHADVAATPHEFSARLRECEYDVVLADYRLPEWTGMDALAALRAQGSDVPLILITGMLGDERAAECVKQGAADYIMKDNLARLPVAVRRARADKRLRDERLVAVDALRTSEERYRLLFESMPLPAWVFDLETHRILALNDAAVRHYGYTREEFLALRIDDLRPPDDIPRLHEHLRTTQPNQGIQSSGVWRHQKKDGSPIVVEIVWHPLPWNGRAAELVVVNDITERRRSGAALEESEARFRKLAEASFDAIDITEEGIVREVNRGFLEMFGYSMEEVIGRPVTDFVADESIDEVRRRGVERVEGTYELFGKRKDGRKLLLEVTSKIHDIGGRPGRVTALRDLTGKRLLEEQFRQAQKMEAVGRLAGGVAHDFNNLLTVITSYADLLGEDFGPSDPRRADLNEIRKAALGAASLTRQLLAFSRQQVVEPRLVVLEEVVASAEKMLRRLLGEDIEVVTALSKDALRVMIDRGQLEQVIMNLAVNARDAMPTGGRLTLETTVVELDEAHSLTHWPSTPGRFAMLAVSDTGTGMDAQTQARIFEPFFTTKELGKGTGLGLATVYGIVKQSGGFIWVYSEPGQGTSFKIYLPLADMGVAQESRVVAEVAPRGKETILVVEDAPDVRAAVREVLERFGYTVLAVASGSVALRVAVIHPASIHLLLTDVVMPSMSGSRLAEQFTAIRPEAKVLYMSGYTDNVVLRHGVLGRGAVYIQKPFAPDTLARKVREVLDAIRAE